MMKSFLSIGKGIYSRAMRLADRNYCFAKAHYMYELRRKQKQYKGPPLVLFQMGKVGSSTIRSSLHALDLDMPIYHTHLLTKARIAETEEKRKKFFRTERYSYLKRPWLNQFLRKQVDDGLLDGKKWKIVTLTREPIARNISTFFENLEVKLLDSGDQYEIKSDYYDIDPIIVKLDDTQELTDLFFDRLRHDSPLVFFDRELKGVFGVDVFASEFSVSKGYKIYKDEKTDVLLIRLENLDDCARDAFKDFLGIDNFTLIDTNIGREKVYAPIYKKLKDSIVLPESYIERMYASKYMRHFYSEEEIARFRAKWSTSRN
jgi:hypothetical protein